MTNIWQEAQRTDKEEKNMYDVHSDNKFYFYQFKS